jgi:HD-GYP domain-containing protein (c-di-GMP phosphodiesterase class II)
VWVIRRRRRGRPRAATERELAELEHAYELTVAALAAALELRDDETGGHARRVTELALRVAAMVDPQLAADPQLRYGFLLHDIGKIGIPDAILLKREPLTENELAQLQMHPTLGESLVSSIPYLSGVAREVIAYHHERLDGAGYPWGLKGEEIPSAARIFAVCDAFDAMTNDRPYRRARSVDDALHELQAGAGAQFDPRVVGALIEIVRDPATAPPGLTAQVPRVRPGPLAGSGGTVAGVAD